MSLYFLNCIILILFCALPMFCHICTNFVTVKILIELLTFSRSVGQLYASSASFFLLLYLTSGIGLWEDVVCGVKSLL